MGGIVRVASPATDERLEGFRALRERDLAARAGLFVGEGPLTVERMLALPGVVTAVLVEERQAERFRALAAPEVAVFAASAAALSDLVGFEFHRGALALGRRAPFEDRPWRELVPAPGRPATLLLVDGVTNVDNIGLLFRNAAAFACDAVLLSASCHDPLYRKALRVSLGHVLSLPFARIGDWRAMLAGLVELEVELVAAALGPDSSALDDYAVPDRVALAVGQEFAGVSRMTLAAARRTLRIPMAPGVDSLNVAAASAVCLHRLSRGRRR